MPRYVILSSTEGRIKLDNPNIMLSAESFWADSDDDAIREYGQQCGEAIVAEEFGALKHNVLQELYRIEWRNKLVKVEM